MSTINFNGIQASTYVAIAIYPCVRRIWEIRSLSLKLKDAHDYEEKER